MKQSADHLEATEAQLKGKTFDPAALEGIETSQIRSMGVKTGFRHMKREQVPLTLAFALGFKEKYPALTFDRSLKDDTVVEYIAKMLDGRFIPQKVILDVVDFNGAIFRLNGQHVIDSVIQLHEVNPEFAKKYSPLISVDHWRVDSEADLRLLYSQIDGGKARNRSDKLNALLFDGDPFRGFTKSQIKHLSEGLHAVLYGCGLSKKHSIEQLSYEMQNGWYAECIETGNYLKGCHGDGGKAFMHRSPVIAAMLQTFRVSKTDSLTFWDGVKTGADLAQFDPRLQLRNILMQYAINAGGKGGRSHTSTGKLTTSGEEMYRWSIAAWNSWRKGVLFQRKNVKLDRPRTAVY